MAAYLIASITVTEPEGYARYRAGAAAVVARHGGRYLVRGGTIHPQEGDLGFDRVVVVAFATMAAARAFYDSAEYAPWLKLRRETTESRLAFVEGFDAA